MVLGRACDARWVFVMGWSLRGEICLRAGHCFPAVRFIDDVIAHKHGIGFMANDVHNHPFWDTGASHVPRGRVPDRC